MAAQPVEALLVKRLDIGKQLLADVQTEAAKIGINVHSTEVKDVMFPGDGLAGATELGLHLRVLAMADLEALLATGVTWLHQRATLQGASDFLALDEAQRLAALDAAFASPDQGIQPFVLALRYHVGTAYYSAPAIKSAFAYTGPPQPDGFADFQERPA